MDVTLTSEGAYPHSFGGVSVWCDQLVRRLSGIRFDLVSLVATGTEPTVWQLPDNVASLTAIPLWGPQAPRRTRRGGGPGGVPPAALGAAELPARQRPRGG